jgi:uncharacterized membrane protein
MVVPTFLYMNLFIEMGMNLNSKVRMLAIVMATAILGSILLSAGSCTEMANGQAAVKQPGTGPKQVSTIFGELRPMRDDVTKTISDAEWTLDRLQVYLGGLIVKKPMTDAERRQLNDLISNANTQISQWGSKRQDVMNKLSDIASQDYSATLPDDAARIQTNVIQLRHQINRADIVISEMKTTIERINKHI